MIITQLYRDSITPNHSYPSLVRTSLRASRAARAAIASDAVVAAATAGVALEGVGLDPLGLDGVGAGADDAVAAVHSLLEAGDALAAVAAAGAGEDLVGRRRADLDVDFGSARRRGVNYRGHGQGG